MEDKNLNDKNINEENYLMISSIQHFIFCRRQWALIHLEQQWSENFFTIDGNIFHEKAHDGLNFEKRNETIISRGMPVISRELGLTGICDIVEFKEDKEGIKIVGRDKLYKVYPVEYKRGKAKESNADRYQLVAQALCLEEMLCCTIEKGYLFYGETRRRVLVEIDQQARDEVRSIVGKMQELYVRGHTPKVKKTKQCISCSLKNICMPELEKQISAKKYLENMLKDGD